MDTLVTREIQANFTSLLVAKCPAMAEAFITGTKLDG